MIRGIIESVVQGVIQRFNAAAWGEPGAVANREFFQHYGLTSRPKAGAEAIMIRSGNVIIAIASDDRRYRLALEEGECALYDDLGQRVHLSRNGIEVSSPVKVTATAPEVEIVAESKVTISSPETQISGNLTVGGTAAVTGALSSSTSVGDSAGTMDSMRQTYNSHTHQENGDGGGTTNPPNEVM